MCPVETPTTYSPSARFSSPVRIVPTVRSLVYVAITCPKIAMWDRKVGTIDRPAFSVT